jgi:cell division protein ZapD
LLSNDRTSAITSHADALHFFRNIGDLLDVFERGEVVPI